jgi:predicted nucleic acid-binding Zn ribbon protein
MKTKAKRDPQRVGAILEKTLKKMSLDRKLKEHEIWNVWNNVVGEHVSRHAQPDFTKNKILFVKVSSSPWMQQLHYMGKGIVEALNKRLGAHVVEEIRFKLGEVDPRWNGSPTSSRSSDTAPCQAKSIPKGIRKTLSSVKDVEIRKTLGKVILKDRGGREGKAR